MKKQKIYIGMILTLALLIGVIANAAEIVANGSTSQSFYLVMEDRNGDPNTNITVTTLDMYYVTDQNTVATKIDCTDLGSENAAFSAGGAYEMGTSGLYRFDFPDAAFRHGAGKRVNLWIDDAVTGTRTAFLCVLLSPPVDAVLVDSNDVTADNLHEFFGKTSSVGAYENFEDKYDGTGYAGGTIVSQADVTKWNGSTNGITNWIIVYNTDFATNYNTTADMWNVNVVDWLGSACATPTAAGVPEVDVTYWYGSAVTGALGSMADLVDAVWDETSTGHVDAGKAGAQVWTKVDNIETDTAEIGAAGVGLTAVPWNASWDAEIQSEVDDALVARFLDQLFGTAYDPSSKPGNASAYLNVLVENDGGVPRFTTNALENAPSGTAVYAQTGSVATGLSTTVFTLGSGVQNDNAFIYMIIAVQDADDSHWESRSISAYTGTTRLVTVSQAFSFTPTTGDAFRIMESSYAVPSSGGGGWW